MANWTAHIHVVALDFGLRNPDLTDARTARALVTGSAGFYFFHTGYRINALFNEVYGARAARYMESGGFRLMRDWQREQPDRFGKLSQDYYPYLFTLRRDMVEPGAIHPLSQLFSAPPQRIGFPGIERRVLERALLSQSDMEITASLGVSMATIKKAWASIFDRVRRRAPLVIPPAVASADGQRGPEKRRHVLGYVQSHLEELRPNQPRSLKGVPA